jgi:GNAT superfamily N-acetyltransferase
MARLIVKPVTAERWTDLEALFGPNGAYSGCWCMYLRLPSGEWQDGARAGGPGNRARLRTLVRRGAEPGLLAYDGARPVGWVAVAPREEYPRVLRSPVHKPIDDTSGVWSVSCFVVARDARGRGVARALLDGAVKFARKQGAQVVEAYPVDPGAERPDDATMWRGTVRMFTDAGFEVVARRKPARPIVRKVLRRSARSDLPSRS